MRFSFLKAVAFLAIATPSAHAQVRLTDDDGNLLVGDTTVCGNVGERVVDCGSTNTGRPDSCCEGLVCSGRSGGNLHMRCWTPEQVAAEDAMDGGDVDAGGVVPASEPTAAAGEDSFCASEGERSQECGAANDSRPPKCCEGFVCEQGNAKVTCTAETNDVPPPVEETESAVTCAEEGGRAIDCGAGDGRPQSCCEGLVCVEGAGVKCIVDPNAPAPTAAAPVMAPTEAEAAPVMSPTMDAMAPAASPTADAAPAAAPVMAPSESAPVMAPTGDAAPVSAPTEAAPVMEPSTETGFVAPPTVADVATSSAFGLVVAYRSFVIGTVSVGLAILLL